MSRGPNPIARGWMRLGPRFLPFADAATTEFPLGRLLRLSLFQISVGMAVVMLNGTLNRVMIVELNVDAWLVALMVALPVAFAPLRVLIGYRSDNHKSRLGWRRVPYIWMGSLLQFGGFAIMPFALLLLSGDTHGPALVGPVSAAAAFLLVGVGLHTTQTAGLALATDLAPAHARPRVVALLYVMLLLGMMTSSLIFGALLSDFSHLRLIQVIQAAALITICLNMIALWKQEVRDPAKTSSDRVRPPLRELWRDVTAESSVRRLLLAVAMGTAAFSMQDILLEPYGGQVLGLSVGATTLLTALLAGGALAGFAVAARGSKRGGDPCRTAGFGVVIGIVAFSAVILAGPFGSVLLFQIGAILIGLGSGMFSVGTLIAAMAIADRRHAGLVVGAWGAAQATAAGVAIAFGGAFRDIVGAIASAGGIGPALQHSSTGYAASYLLEIILLLVTLVVIGPLARHTNQTPENRSWRLGLAELPS